MDKYKLRICGKNTNLFFKLLISKRIKLYSIDRDIDTLKIIIDKDDYEKVRKIKTDCKIEVINRFGVIKIKYLLYKYKYILISFVITIFLIIFLSNIVFSIEVMHQKEEVRDLILNDLKSFGLKKYGFKISYSKKEKIKKKILEKEKDKIEWIEIENIGTKYIINVEERLLNKNKEDDSCRDVVASTDAMILRIEASSGEIVRKKYDYVKKGDVLISGTIKNKDREVAKVKADGHVLGEVWYKVSVILPKKYHEETRTGSVYKSLTLRIAGRRISLPIKNKNKSYETHDKILFKNRLLPIKLVIEENYELKVIDKAININNADSEAISIATKNLNIKLKDNSTILTKKVLKKTINNSTILVDVFFKVEQDITSYKNISSELKEGEDSESSN